MMYWHALCAQPPKSVKFDFCCAGKGSNSVCLVYGASTAGAVARTGWSASPAISLPELVLMLLRDPASPGYYTDHQSVLVGDPGRLHDELQLCTADDALEARADAFQPNGKRATDSFEAILWRSQRHPIERREARCTSQIWFGGVTQLSLPPLPSFCCTSLPR